MNTPKRILGEVATPTPFVALIRPDGSLSCPICGEEWQGWTDPCNKKVGYQCNNCGWTDTSRGRRDS